MVERPKDKAVPPHAPPYTPPDIEPSALSDESKPRRGERRALDVVSAS